MDKNKYKILVVDDAKENREIVVKILSSIGYKTRAVSDGLTALRLLKEDNFDLILLDVMMPIMGGLETCSYIKVDPETSNIPVIFLTASDDRDTLTKAYNVGGCDYIKKPFFKEELIARVNSKIKLRDYEKNFEQKVKTRTKEISDTQIQLVYTLGGIAEGHSEETFFHVKRVAEFTYRLAILYGMDEKEATKLKNASSLHDIGKLAVTDNILHKNGVLDKKEYKEIQKHASLGSKMLQKSELPLFKTAAIVCEQHHEKWDGSGYPKGLKGENIHIYGRVVAIADVFDALSFKRSYKVCWSENEVLKFIKDMRGKHFDPKLVDIFFEYIDEFLIIYNTNLENIKLEKNLNGEMSKTEKILDWLLRER